MAMKTEIIEKILEELLRKYGSYREASKILSVNESNLKSTIATMSEKTKLKLEDLGINIDNTNNQTISGGALIFISFL
ncbi:MAG: hypothetical protein FD143_3332 [Ignavibacteria bacterium]|nr:MAG: hypothetical protein FD143_3332 [Ignavibacteria bacterium]